MILGTIVVALVLTLAPIQAWAACAWVLWQETTDLATGYTPMVGTDSERDCGARKAEYERRPRPSSIDKDTELRYLCLPETIDPRGPRSAARWPDRR